MPPTAVSAAQKARILAEALPFIRAFHASTLIIRFGGGAMVDRALKEGFARDVALLRLVGMNPIVVHGGGWRIDELLRTMDIPIREHRGMRIVDEPTMNVIEMVLDEINQDLVGLINRFGAKAVGLNGQDGRFIHARPMILPPDQSGAACPTSGLSETSNRSISTSSTCCSPRFRSGDHADRRRQRRHRLPDQLGHRRRTARSRASRRKADHHDQRRRHPRWRRPARVRADGERCRGLLRKGVVPAEEQPRLIAALAAVREGVRSVHIIDGGAPSALLLEVLTNSGVGTALRSDSGPHFLADARSYFAASVDT
jgi:acetylglutamate kinase